MLVTSEFPPLPGGIGNHAHQLALHLTQEGYRLTVLTDYRTYEQEEELRFDAGQPYTVLRISRKTRRFGMYLNRVRAYRKLLSKADVVLASGKFSLWLVGFASFGFGPVPKVAILHGSEVNFKAKVLKWSIEQALGRFDTTIAVSRFTAGLVKHLPLEPVVIPNGIDLSQWEANQRSNPRLQGQPVLATVGRVSTRKGQLQVIKHLPALKQHFPDLQYHCIGIPSEAAAFMAQATALGVADQVHFHGAVPDSSLKALLRATDVFVMLSTESATGDVEGFGIAILEANALGIPAIGALGSGVEEAVRDGHSGILVEPHDQLAFKQALETLLQNREHFKQGALDWASQHDWKRIVKTYQQVVEDVLRTK